jgi:hypothetical protein
MAIEENGMVSHYVQPNINRNRRLVSVGSDFELHEEIPVPENALYFQFLRNSRTNDPL